MSPPAALVTPLASVVLAHQGGWDEIILVLTPLVIFAGLLALARRRVGQLERSTTDGSDDVDDDDDAGGDGRP